MHVFFFKEAWRSFTAHRGLASTAIFSISAALTLSGVFLLLSHNAELALRALGDRREMVVYLRDEVSETERTMLIEKMHSLYGDVTYVSKAQAWEEFSQQVGDQDLLGAVDTNPLPASLRIKLKGDLLNFPAMQEAAQQVSQFPEVEDVRYGAEWVRRLDALSASLHRGALAVGIVVAMAIVFVLYNTLRLTVLARRHQVEIMSRLGAGDRFVATPFLIEGMLVAGFAALISLGLLFGIQQVVAARMLGVSFLPWTWCLTFVGAAIGLAWIASALALSRVLRSVGP